MIPEINQFGIRDIPNIDLTVNDIPSPWNDYWSDINQFALTFDGYAYHPEDCGEIANQSIEQYSKSGRLPTSLTELRTCLFFEQRRWRHFEDSPDPDSLSYIYALVDAIRAKVAAVEQDASQQKRRSSVYANPVLLQASSNPESHDAGIKSTTAAAISIPGNSMIDIPELMHALSLQRGVFHSEADFQHAFAWEVHRRLPTASVRLERPIKLKEKTLHLDFLLQLPNQAMAVELKYKTRKLTLEVEGEQFRLASHSAADLGRYDFIKDVCRLEEITSNLQSCEGWAILLTNDSAYWKAPFTKVTVDTAFRVHEGRVLHGTLGWTENASDGTKRNRENDLNVAGRYPLRWCDYAIPSDQLCGQLRFLAVHVPKCG
jgi:hypothetical protein